MTSPTASSPSIRISSLSMRHPQKRKKSRRADSHGLTKECGRFYEQVRQISGRCFHVDGDASSEYGAGDGNYTVRSDDGPGPEGLPEFSVKSRRNGSGA